MFSAQQLQNFAGKKRITQATFDEAVQENIDEFDMEASFTSYKIHSIKYTCKTNLSFPLFFNHHCSPRKR